MLERRIQKQIDEDQGKIVHQRDPNAGKEEFQEDNIQSGKRGCKRSMAVNVQVVRTVMSVMKAKKAS